MKSAGKGKNQEICWWRIIFLIHRKINYVTPSMATPIFQQLPEAIVFPENEEQISDIVKLANQEKFNIVPRGAGTGLKRRVNSG